MSMDYDDGDMDDDDKKGRDTIEQRITMARKHTEDLLTLLRQIQELQLKVQVVDSAYREAQGVAEKLAQVLLESNANQR